jgi:hypothetical protein
MNMNNGRSTTDDQRPMINDGRSTTAIYHKDPVMPVHSRRYRTPAETSET